MPRQVPARSARSRGRKPVVQDAAPVALTNIMPDEKHALILDHARRRVAHPPGNVLGMYLGVAICAVLILVGWAIALPKTLNMSGGGGDTAIGAVREHGSQFTRSFADDRSFEGTGRLLESMRQEIESAP